MELWNRNLHGHCCSYNQAEKASVSVFNKCTQSRSTTPTHQVSPHARSKLVSGTCLSCHITSSAPSPLSHRGTRHWGEQTSSVNTLPHRACKYAECQEWEEHILKDTIQFSASIILLGNTGGWKLWGILKPSKIN